MSSHPTHNQISISRNKEIIFQDGSNSNPYTATPNQCYFVEGKQIWHSRSIAVLGIPIIKKKGEYGFYVPLGKRSDTVDLYNGRWALPGGYLEWDETVEQALKRELWEELGLSLTSLSDGNPYWGTMQHPYKIFSDPTQDTYQNVTLRYAALYYVSNPLPMLKPCCDEVTEAKWWKVDNALMEPLAFNHNEILTEITDFLEEIETL